MPKKPDTLTLEEIAKTPQTMPLAESVSKELSKEEINVYTELTKEFLLFQDGIDFETKVMALSLLKTLSHLSGNKDVLQEMYKSLPLNKNREIYYAVPFLPELDAKGKQLEWYQKEFKQVMEIKKVKGMYLSARLLALFYESLVFHVATDRMQRKAYLKLAQPVFKKAREVFQDLNTAYRAKNDAHDWFSTKTVDNYREVVMLWKQVVDITTIRHGKHLPAQFKRPKAKLPEDWARLLDITSHKKVSMLNSLYPLNGLASLSREIRTYSSFLLHLVYKERPGFLDSFHYTQVERPFLNRLRVAHKLKEAFPLLPQGIPEKFQREMFLVLTEQAIHSLAVKYKLDEMPIENLAESFTNFGQQVQVKDEIQVEVPDVEEDSDSIFEDTDDSIFADPSEESEENQDTAEAEKAEPPPIAKPQSAPEEEETSEEEDDKLNIRAPLLSDFPAITDMEEFGMHIQTMPYVFPFSYEPNQQEAPLENLPNIRWEDMKWSYTVVKDKRVATADTKIFTLKLEIVHAYRYDIIHRDDVAKAKVINNLTCFIVKDDVSGTDRYLIMKKGSKSQTGKSRVFIALELSDKYMSKIDKAFFVTLPPDHKHHFLCIPRN